MEFLVVGTPKKCSAWGYIRMFRGMLGYIKTLNYRKI